MRKAGVVCVLFVPLMLLLAVVLSACGDQYSGLWSGTMPDGERMRVQIEMQNDGWVLSLVDAPDQGTLTGTEVDDQLSVSQGGTTMLFERQGDGLILSLPGVSDTKIAFTKE